MAYTCHLQPLWPMLCLILRLRATCGLGYTSIIMASIAMFACRQVLRAVEDDLGQVVESTRIDCHPQRSVTIRALEGCEDLDHLLIRNAIHSRQRDADGLALAIRKCSKPLAPGYDSLVIRAVGKVGGDDRLTKCDIAILAEVFDHLHHCGEHDALLDPRPRHSARKQIEHLPILVEVYEEVVIALDVLAVLRGENHIEPDPFIHDGNALVHDEIIRILVRRHCTDDRFRYSSEPKALIIMVSRTMCEISCYMQLWSVMLHALALAVQSQRVVQRPPLYQCLKGMLDAMPFHGL